MPTDRKRHLEAGGTSGILSRILICEHHVNQYVAFVSFGQSCFRSIPGFMSAVILLYEALSEFDPREEEEEEKEEEEEEEEEGAVYSIYSRSKQKTGISHTNEFGRDTKFDEALKIKSLHTGQKSQQKRGE
ncbi:hypothetical protein PAMP_011686 [Pampus punctatissimus]